MKPEEQAEEGQSAADGRQIEQWVIYDHPKDFPGSFIARRWLIGVGEFWPTDEIIVGATQAGIEVLLRRKGLVKLLPNAEDDPKIVAIWI